MTAADTKAPHLPPPGHDTPTVRRSLTVLCPYLAAADGDWRSSTVAREHRCGAVSPPAPLAAEKQRRLCLTADHPTCATYEAARASRPIAHDRPPTLPRPLARTTPVVLDHGRIVVGIPALRSDRSTAQMALVALLGVAFALIILARVTGGGGVAGAGDASPTPAITQAASAPPASARPSARPTATPVPGSSAQPTGSNPPGPSAKPSGSPAGSSSPAPRTYKVKAGDTLIGIAAKFGTTPKAIATLNGLSDLSSLKIGQVLKIPDAGS